MASYGISGIVSCARSETGRHERDADAQEQAERAGPVDSGGVQDVLVERLERCDRQSHIERRGHEADREHDRGRREDDVDLERIEDVREQADAAGERRQEPDARHGGRQYERQLDQRDHERPATEAPRAEQVRRGRADEQDDGQGDHVRDGRQLECVEHDRIAQLVDQEVEWHTREDRHDRQNEEADHDDGGDEDPHPEGAVSHAAHVTSWVTHTPLCI